MAYAGSRACPGDTRCGPGQSWSGARSKGVPARVVERVRIVLLAADGLTGAQICRAGGCTEPTVIKWRRRYSGSGLAGLETPRAAAGR